MKPNKGNKHSAAPDLIEQTRESLELETVIGFFACKAQTHEGKRCLSALKPMVPQRQEEHFQGLQRWARFLADHGSLCFPAVPSAAFFKRNPRLKPFSAEELRSVRDVLTFWREVCRVESLGFAYHGLPLEQGLDALARRLAELFRSDGHWRDDISPLYKSLIRQWFQVEAQLKAVLASALRRYGAYLNEALLFERNNRQVLAVKLNFRGRVKGILHDYSSSGNTVYIEPQESVDRQNLLVRHQSEMNEELWRIRCEVSEAILEHRQIGEEICPRMARMDMMQALAQVARETQCQILRPNDKRELTLYQARHPFLDAHFAECRRQAFRTEERDRNHMVPFNLQLDHAKRGLVISGANTGGKTVTLKTTGLLAWMANCGLPVPVDEGSRIPYYRAIFADIGDHQSLAQNLSTFASHLANMSRIFSLADETTLILLDELGSGTDPREGSALAQAMIELIVAKGCQLLVTTHQQILCTLALTHERLENGSMVFDHRLLRPTYRFSQGIPGRSHALEIAAKAGLPEDVLTRARFLVDEDQVDIGAAIVKLQDQHNRMLKQKHKLRRDELRLHRRIKETKEEHSQLERRREELRDKSRRRLEKTIEKAERELRNLLSEVPTTRQKAAALNRFSKVRQALIEPFKAPETPPELVPDASRLPAASWSPGDLVMLKSWRQRGTLISMDRKQARVDCQGKVLIVNLDEVLHLNPSSVPKADPRVDEYLETGADDHLSVELKLLGFRVDDALMALDEAIDKSLRTKAPFLKIIHGHGSGALKTGIRGFLRNHVAKDCFRTEVSKENDGITELYFE